ncbi:MAG: leucine-rich repeat protein [Oscillospiraceae bacterium]|nr:leucine-rich repeat protein [Oscillospiraceae bacterium]
MNRITLRHALKRIGAGMTAAVTGAVLLLQIPTAALAVDDTEGTTSGGFDYTIKDGVVTVTGYSGEDRETVTKLTVPKTISGIAVTKIGRNAFSDMKALSSIKLPDGLEKLEDNVFWGCESLKELTLPKGMPRDSIARYSYIGGWGSTFRESYIEKIILEDGAQYVPTNLCYGAGHLRTVIIPDTVTEIGASAFQCESVTEIDLPDSVQIIGSDAFKNCGITSITLPEGLTQMGSCVFEGCKGITELTVPSTLTEAKYALAVSSIETLTVADGMETLPERLAQKDSALRTVHLPRSVTGLGYGTFAESGITEFTLPKQVVSGDSCFGESALEALSFEDGLEIIPAKMFRTAKALKTISWTPDITEIGEDAFQYCNGLETVEIPDTVQTVGFRAFYDCEGLKTLRLPENGMKLGSYAFYDCTALESVYLPMMAIDPETGTYYKDYNSNFFSYCKGLKKIEFAPEMKVIPESVCYHCESLTDIVFPTAPETIDRIAFEYCSALKTVTIPDSVTAINEFAFDGCESLETLHLPESLDHIGREAFRNTYALKELYLPHELTDYAGYYPFNHSGVETLVIADGITEIGSTTFAAMDNLRTVIFPDSVTKICDKAFLECYALTGVKLPPNLESVSDNSFGYCYSLTELTIPKTLTGKGWAAFNQSGITELTFEDGMTAIPEDLFRNMPELRTVHIPESVTEIKKGAFGGCTALETIDAPLDSYKIYSTTFDDCDSLDDERFVVALKKDSFINCTASADAENKMTHYTVYYSVNPRFRELMSDIRLEVSTAWRADIIRESLPENISAGQGGFSFTPEKPEGVIRFSIRTQDEEDTSVKVTLGVKQSNDWDWAGWYKKNIVSPGVPAPALSLNAPSRAKQADGKAAFTVAGYAPAGAEVTITVTNKNMADTVSEQTVTASPYTGRYTADLEIAAENSNILSVKAVCGSLSEEASVICDAGQNEIIKVLMKYNGHDYTGNYYYKTLDITESFTVGTMPYFTYNPSYPLGFEVTLKNNDCEQVFMSSAVNGKASVIELKFDEETGVWSGEGRFDTAVPGVLNVLTFPKSHTETAYRHQNSDCTETLEINGHEALSFMKDTPDPVEEFVRATDGRIVASDEKGVITSYNCTEPGGEACGIVSYVGQQESVMLGGKKVTPADVLKDPEAYGFETSPLVVADDDGTYHVYLIKCVTDSDEVQEVFSNLNMDIDVPAPAEPRAGAASFDDDVFEREYNRRIPSLLRLASGAGEHADTLSKFANGTILSEVSLKINPATGPVLDLDKSGTAQSFAVTVSDAIGKEALSQGLQKALGEKTGGAYAKWGGKALSWAECGVAATHMVYQQKQIIGSRNEYINKNEDKLINTSIALTMAKATHILCGGAAIGEAVTLGAAAIAGGAAAAPVILTVGAVVGLVWGVGLLLDKAISIFDETITAGSQVSGDGRVRPIIDPSGTVYEFLPSNPVEGVTAEIYYQDEDGKAVLWNAEDYDQVNPQITDRDGWFAWDVPEGLWQVRLTKEGYTSAKSDWLPVLPVQVGIDLNMTSELPAKFAGTEMNEDSSGIVVKFTKHMKDSTATAESLSLQDQEGSVIPCTIKPVKEEGNDTECSMAYVLIPKESCEVYGVSITPDMQTYAGTPFEDGGAGLPGVRIEKKAAGLFGDVDGDGEVTAYDSMLVLRGFNDIILELDPEDYSLTPEQIEIGDVDLDGELTAFDAAMILKYFNLMILEMDPTWYDLIGKPGVPGAP